MTHSIVDVRFIRDLDVRTGHVCSVARANNTSHILLTTPTCLSSFLGAVLVFKFLV